MKKIASLFICFSIFILNASFASELMIVDDFANSTLDKNLKIKQEIYKPIIDEFATNSLNKALKIEYNEPILIVDDFAQGIKNYEKITYNKNQNFDFEKIDIVSIKIRPLNYQTTRKNILVGDKVDFFVENNFEYKGKIYKKGDMISARIENVNLNKAYGVPADMIIGDFSCLLYTSPSPRD